MITEKVNVRTTFSKHSWTEIAGMKLKVGGSSKNFWNSASYMSESNVEVNNLKTLFGHRF